METAYLDSGQIFVHNLVSTMMDATERNMRLDLIQKTGARLVRDGNQWCYILGEMPVDYVAGFGKSPYDAMQDFWNEFHKDLKSTRP